jgi:hypothetical protein
MPFSTQVSGNDAQQSLDRKLSIGKQRRVPQTDEIIREFATQKTYRIFNVGPWPQIIRAGSYGVYLVPACKKGEEFAVCNREVKGLESEYTIKDEYEYNTLLSKGEPFVSSLIGEGRGQDPSQSLRHYGLFYSETEPTSDNIYQARQMLNATCATIVSEARDLFAMDRKQFTVVVKRDRHFVAAAVLNLTDEPWMLEQTPSSRTKCRYCATMNDAEAVLCSKCNKPIDMARYKALMAEDEAAMDEPKRGPGRPRKEQPAE